MEGDHGPTGHLHGDNSRKLHTRSKNKIRDHSVHLKQIGQADLISNGWKRRGTNLVEISVGDGGDLLLDGLEHAYGDVQPRVGGVRLQIGRASCRERVCQYV